MNCFVFSADSLLLVLARCEVLVVVLLVLPLLQYIRHACTKFATSAA
jgi:hypothetical protein